MLGSQGELTYAHAFDAMVMINFAEQLFHRWLVDFEPLGLVAKNVSA